MDSSNRAKIIKRYENMMYKFGEYDVWQDDILPKLATMSTKEIKSNYLDDKQYYESRKLYNN